MPRATARGIVYAGAHDLRPPRHATPLFRLTELEGFAAHDRVLVAAPHPDDESLATGGMLQAAGAAGAARRVLIVTDGDNNPWPQRWAEKRWHIGAADRARWGARRRAEALAALGVLGVADADVRCFGLADLGLTDALMRDAPDLVGLLREQLEQFGPTRVFLPALGDRHPDHSALHVALRLALMNASGTAPRLHAFGVHGQSAAKGGLTLALNAAQRDTKRKAIMQHATQMRLSRRRFVAYAREQESFRPVAWQGEPDPQHPLQGRVDGGSVRIVLNPARWGRSLRGYRLLVVLRRGPTAPLRCSIDPTAAASGRLRDIASGAALGEYSLETGAGATVCRIQANCTGGWVKLAREPGLFVFDRFGWQTIAASAI